MDPSVSQLDEHTADPFVRSLDEEAADPEVRPLPVERLTELVIHLSGAGNGLAREAVAVAMVQHGEWGDGLLNVAEALVALRRLSDPGPPPILEWVNGIIEAEPLNNGGRRALA